MTRKTSSTTTDSHLIGVCCSAAVLHSLASCVLGPAIAAISLGLVGHEAIGDRLGITGARWSLPGAQAMLWMRAIAASGDLTPYWNWHITHEHQRNHLSKFHNPPAHRNDLHLAA